MIKIIEEETILQFNESYFQNKRSVKINKSSRIELDNGFI
jgi:hypothetical protein